MPKTVETKLDLWINKLIDLSKRNNMINFRPTKRTTIHVIDELPIEIFKEVIGRHEPLKFLDFDSWETPYEYSLTAKIPATEFVRHDDSDLADRYFEVRAGF